MLTPSVKWGVPVYSLGQNNIVGISAFKSYIGLWFFQGALLGDKAKQLLNAQEGKTRAMRQLRFTSVREMDTTLIAAYIEEAIANSRNGITVEKSRNDKVILPEELLTALHQDQKLAQAFSDFTPYKQKEFSEYITEAKREITRHNRLEKIKPLILAGIGINDKYRKG